MAVAQKRSCFESEMESCEPGSVQGFCIARLHGVPTAGQPGQRPGLRCLAAFTRCRYKRHPSARPRRRARVADRSSVVTIRQYLAQAPWRSGRHRTYRAIARINWLGSTRSVAFGQDVISGQHMVLNHGDLVNLCSFRIPGDPAVAAVLAGDSAAAGCV